jgi:hypothetical protein
MSVTTQRPPQESPSPRPSRRRPARLVGLAGVLVRRRRRVLLVWIAMLALIAGLSPLVSGEF